MIKTIAKALWAINEMAPKFNFKVTGLHPNGPDAVITSNLEGPLFIEHEHDTYILTNEVGDELFRSKNLLDVVAAVCRISFSDWVTSRMENL